jgi:hypothetical protein
MVMAFPQFCFLLPLVLGIRITFKPHVHVGNGEPLAVGPDHEHVYRRRQAGKLKGGARRKHDNQVRLQKAKGLLSRSGFPT